MNKTRALAAAALLSVAFLTSCKKDYTCTCKMLGASINKPIDDATKKDAESACEDWQNILKSKGDPSATCSL